MKKKILGALFVACALNSSLMMASAGSLVGYSGYVIKSQDIVTDPLKKNTTGIGVNWVEYVEENRQLTCWIQEKAKRITNKKSYNDSGYQKMIYNDPIAAQGAEVSLAVSTSIITMQKTFSFGAWNPDDVK